MTNKYTALSLGPILKTLNMAKKTRELWASSYVFSYLMKQILSELHSQNHADNILLPYFNPQETTNNYGAGLYPDRLILQNHPDRELHLEKIVAQSIEKFAYKVAGHLNAKKETVTTEEVKTFFVEYFRYIVVEKELTEADIEAAKDTDGKWSPVHIINNYLDHLELQEKFIPKVQDKKHYLANYFHTVNKQPDLSPLLKDAFGSGKQFPSIIEIATAAFKQVEGYDEAIAASFGKSDEANEEIAVKQIKLLAAQKGIEFKTHHKYIAIIQADGDSIGTTITEIGNDAEKIKQFSQALHHFAAKAAKEINNYGGAPIYIGGDDVLAFAPLSSENANVFELMTSLNHIFSECFTDFNIKPSLSFGLSISYYKFPMYEALEQARDLLFLKAKNYKGKNAVAFKVLKHSGQYFGASIGNNSKVYTAFRNILQENINNQNFLNSVPHKLLASETLLNTIGSNEERVEQYIDNNFNESIHKTKPYSSFLDALKKLIPEVFTAYPDQKEAVNTIYSSLRMVKFFNRKDNDNE